ncbi:MAG: hypothetical protein WBC86_21610, partial [Pseudolabrys sp.]
GRLRYLRSSRRCRSCIHILSPENVPHFVPAFHRGLKEAGFVEAKTSQSNTAGRMASMTECLS